MEKPAFYFASAEKELKKLIGRNHVETRYGHRAEVRDTLLAQSALLRVVVANSWVGVDL